MQRPTDPLTEMVSALLDAVERDPRLSVERDLAFREFFGDGASKPDAAAVARAQEWFLFERRSAPLGDVPPCVLAAESASAQLSDGALELLDEIGSNAFGAFEAAESDDALLTLRDVLSARRFSIADSDASASDDGALYVGRLFAKRDGSYVVSPTAVVLTGAVAEALRRDLEGLRDARHGRLSQIQMERLLFGLSEQESAAPEDLEQLEAELTAWLEAARMPGRDLDDVRRRFEQSPTVGEAVSSLLDEAAFESDADLEVGRRLLPAYYTALRRRAERVAPSEPAERDAAPDPETGMRAAPSAPCPCGSGEEYQHCCRARDAVARFESGRRAGESLQQLFAQLEESIGVESEDESDDGAPLWPEEERLSVRSFVDAMVWERAQLGAPVDDARRARLEALGDSIDAGPGAPADPSGVVLEHLQRFLFVERYVAGAADDASQRNDLEAAADFAQWLAQEQDVDWSALLTACSTVVARDAARLERANDRLAADGGPNRGSQLPSAPEHAYRVQRKEPRGSECGLLLEPAVHGAPRRTVVLPAPTADPIEIGDCLLFARPQHDSHPARALPREAWPFLVGAHRSASSAAE